MSKEKAGQNINNCEVVYISCIESMTLQLYNTASCVFRPWEGKKNRATFPVIYIDSLKKKMQIYITLFKIRHLLQIFGKSHICMKKENKPQQLVQQCCWKDEAFFPHMSNAQ